MGYTQFIATAYMLRMLSDKERFEKFLISRNINQRKVLLPGIKLIFRFILDEHIRQLESGTGFTLETDRVTQRALYVGADIREISSNSGRAKILRGLRTAESMVLKSRTLSVFVEAISREFNPWFSAIEKLWSNATALINEELQSWKKTDVRTLQVFGSLLMLLNINSRLFGFIRYDHDWRKSGKAKKEAYLSNEFSISFLGYKAAAAYLWNSFRNRYTPESPVDELLAVGDWNDLDDMFRVVADGIVAEADELLGGFGGNSFLRTRKYNPRELTLMMKEAELKRGRTLYDRLDENLLWYGIELLDLSGSWQL